MSRRELTNIHGKHGAAKMVECGSAPLVALVPTNLVIRDTSVARGILNLTTLLTARCSQASGLFIFPLAPLFASEPEPSVTRYTKDQAAGSNAHTAALVLHDLLAESVAELEIQSDFRPTNDDLASPVDLDHLAGRAFPGYAALVVPEVGQGTYAPGFAAVSLCQRLFTNLSVVASATDVPAPDPGPLTAHHAIRWAASSGLPSSAFAVAEEHSIGIDVVALAGYR